MSIKISKIRDILEEDTYSLLGLCTSDKINMWSTYKPVMFNNKATALTTNDFRYVDYGYSGFIFSSPFDLIHNLNTGWSYTKPFSYFRISDFNGYNHNQEKWYLVEVMQNYDSVNVVFNTDLAIFLSFKSLSSYTDLDFGFLIAPALNELTLSCYYYRVNNVLDIDEKYSFNVSELPKGTYKVVPVLTTEIRNTGLHTLNRNTTFYGSWFMFPTEPLNIEVTHIPPYANHIELSADNASWNIINESINDLHFDLLVIFDNSYTGSPIYYAVDLVFKNAYIGNVVKDINIASVSGTISSGETKVHHIEYNNAIGYLAGDYDTRIPLTASLTVGSTLVQKNIYLMQ